LIKSRIYPELIILKLIKHTQLTVNLLKVQRNINFS